MASEHPVSVLTEINVRRECSTSLSERASNLLKFRLFEDTEGIWVCCDWCEKWRYMANQKDPAPMVNCEFRCKDVMKKCEGGNDEGFDEIFYRTDFCAGSLVWAKRPVGRNEKKWLWWPAIVEDSPDSMSQYFLLDEAGCAPIAYHVTYLDFPRTGGWLRSDLVKPFRIVKKGWNKASKSRTKEQQRLFREAVSLAEKAAKLGLVQRLEKYSHIAHLARLEGIIPSSSGSSDEIVNATDEAHEDTVEVLPGLSQASNPAKDASNEENSHGNQKSSSARRKRGSNTDENEARAKKAKLETKSETKSSRASKRKATADSLTETVVEALGPVPSEEKTVVENDSGYAVNGDSPVDQPHVEKPPSKRPKRNAVKEDSKNSTLTELETEPPSSQEREHSGSRAEPVKPKKRNQKRSTTVEGRTSAESATGVVDAAKEGNEVTRKHSGAASGTTNVPGSNVPARPVKAKRNKKKTEERDSGAGISQDSSLRENNQEVPDSVPDTSELENSDPEQTARFLAESMPEMGSSFVANEADSTLLGAEPKSLPASPSGLPKKNRMKNRNVVHNENKPSAPFFTQPKKTAKTKTRKEESALVESAHRVSMSQPAPSRTRGKFAPPTKPKTAQDSQDSYGLDDFQRDLSQGVL